MNANFIQVVPKKLLSMTVTLAFGNQARVESKIRILGISLDT